MKQITSLLILLLICVSCKNETANGYVLTGTIDNAPEGTQIILKSLEDMKQVDLDTATVTNGKFSFEGTIDEPNLCFLILNEMRGRIPFILENKNLDFTLYKDSLSLSRITGSKENDLSLEYMDYLKAIKKRGQKLSQPYAIAKRDKDSALMQELEVKMDALRDESKAYNKDFLTKNKNSLFNAFLFENLLNSKAISPKDSQSILDEMSDETLNLAPIKRIQKKINAESNTAEGEMAPLFSGPNPEGKILALNDIKGKATIIDFWAAWCRPCRKENPNVVKIYKEYHSKGLEIVGVSLDGSTRQKDAKSDWTKAISDDNLTWHHISNLNYFNDPIAQLYNIQSIPATYILDSDGRIVAKNLRGKALEDKIAEMLN